MKRYLILMIALPFLVFSESPDTTLLKIFNLKYTIINTTNRYNVDPLLLAAIVYAERTENYDWKDDALDIILAKSGMNSSLGFCQIKLKTAYWIETQLNDSTSLHYPGSGYYKLLTLSKNPTELIKKLMNDTLNIKYAAAYMCIIQNRWNSLGFTIEDKPEIVGTLYSIGLFNYRGKERYPHNNPIANSFGNRVKKGINIIKAIFIEN